MSVQDPQQNSKALVVAHDLAKTFDVSAPWLSRVIERKPRQLLKAVDGVSFEIERGKTLALVGESGCGKSITALALMRLIPQPPGRITSGQILFEGKDLLQLPEAQMRRVRGNRISMIFQEPMTSLNPAYSVGDQIMESVRLHQGLDAQAALARAISAGARLSVRYRVIKGSKRMPWGTAAWMRAL